MFDQLLKDGVALMKTLLDEGGLMATVQHRSAQLDGGGNPVLDQFGEPTLLAPVARKAVVADTDEIIRNDRGETLVAAYRVQFLEAVAVTVHDVIELPGGRKRPIARVDGGLLDRTGAHFLTGVLCA